jgi:hypothetical protein
MVSLLMGRGVTTGNCADIDKVSCAGSKAVIICQSAIQGYAWASPEIRKSLSLQVVLDDTWKLLEEGLYK